MHLASYLGLLRDSEQALGDAFRMVAEHHKDEPDVEHLCTGPLSSRQPKGFGTRSCWMSSKPASGRRPSS
ncbi:hypothetical protein [Kribbella endophytica]